jgi:pyruvate kinase
VTAEIQHHYAYRVWDIYHKVVQTLERTAFLYPTASQQYSAQNLLAYLAYKQHVTSEFLTEIKERGLAISTWEHMVHSLALCCVNAGLMKPPDQYPSLSSSLQARSVELFGARRDYRSPHIMLTLDTRIANPQTLEKLLLNGMSIARINCAHDDEASWLQMIASIRQAERHLRAQGLYDSRSCKIMMDLAGPKIRIHKIVKESTVIKIGNARDDAMGTRSRRTAIGLIASVDSPAAASDRDIDFYISVSRIHEPMRLVAGDLLTFRDRRNKKRSMTVILVTPQHIYVQANQPAYIGEGTRLTNNEKQMILDIVRVRLDGSQLRVRENDRIRVLRKPVQETETSMSTDEIVSLTVNFPHTLSTVMAGHSVYFDDGKAQGRVTASTDAYFDVEIVSPRSPVSLSPDNGINFPDSDLSGSSGTLTDKDKRDLSFISRHADIVGISFLHYPRDLRAIGQAIQHMNPGLAIVAKIETKNAVHNFSNLLFEGLAFDRFGVMIARGDLAIEAGFQQLSVIQEEILPMCRAAHIPVVLATQILDTFAKKGMPTRPELSDLSFGSEFDCIMLNKGPYMVNVVNFIAETFVMLAQMKSNGQSITRPE